MNTVKQISLTLFTWCLCILFGAIIFNTVVLYPNYFRQIPQSLELTMEFLKVRGPHHFFPPFGTAIILLNIVSLVLWWKTKNIRYILLTTVILLIVFEFIFSVTFFWGKNTIMFIEGKSKHPAEFLQATANSFQNWNWVRVITTGLASILAIYSVTQLKKNR